MTQAWNPSATGMLGLEWPAVQEGAQVISADSHAALMQLVSKANESISYVDVYLNSVVAPSVGVRRYVVDIYDTAGDEIAGTTTCTRIPPNAQANVGAGWTGSYTSIDEVNNACDQPPNVSKTDYMATNDPSQSFDLEFGTAAFGLDTRITQLLVGINGGTIDSRGGTISLVDVGTGTAYLLGSLTLPFTPDGGTTQYVDLGEINPITLEPWTPADIRKFDSSTYRIRYSTSTPWMWDVRIYAVWLQVTTIPELRVARAVGAPSPLSAGWKLWDVKAIDTATGLHSGALSKAAAKTYTCVLRRALQGQVPADATTYTTGGSISWRSLQGGTIPVGVGSGQANAPIDVARNGALTTAASTSTASGFAYALLMLTGALAVSDDGQPYASGTALAINTSSGVVQQEFSGAAVLSYGVIAIVLRGEDGLTPAADLVVQLRRRSDSVLLATFTITSAAWLTALDAGNGYRLVRAQAAAPVTLAAATQYYLDFASTAAVGHGWEIPALATLMAGAATVSYNSTTDAATVAGVELTTIDLPVLVGTVPSTPAGLTVTQQSHATGGSGFCFISSIPFIRVDWTSTALGASFLQYQVQRSEDGGTTWADVAIISTEATSVFDDYEHRFGISVSYRVRVVRTDGAASGWTAPASATVTVAMGGLYFTSNTVGFDPLAYQDVYEGSPLAEFEFVDASEVVVARMFGRDRQVVFRPTEQRGVQFQRTLLVHSDACGVTPGSEVDPFSALRAMSHDDSPYVCVRNGRGDRWFASVIVAGGQFRRFGAVFMADITVVEVAAEPLMSLVA